MIIKPKNDMRFIGSKSGRPMWMHRNVLLEVDPDELKAIDKADYDVVDAGKSGEVVREVPPRKKK